MSYKLHYSNDLRFFYFVSDGRKGKIDKVIAFIPIGNPIVVNLVMGNKILNSSQIDDQSVNDNGDRDKIFTTVLNAIDYYTTYYPERYIIFKGSTPSRTRLYRAIIGNNLYELNKRYDLYA